MSEQEPEDTGNGTDTSSSSMGSGMHRSSSSSSSGASSQAGSMPGTTSQAATSAQESSSQTVVVEPGSSSGAAATSEMPAGCAGNSVGTNDAVITRDTLPAVMECGTTASVTVVVRNAGVTTWTRGLGYRLGANGDSDPLGGAGRVEFSTEADCVAPGSEYSFSFTLTAPSSPGSYTTDWRMVLDGVEWFGATASREVQVNCAELDGESIFASAGIYNSPGDTAAWPVTTRITRLQIGANGVLIDFDKKDGPERWPDITPPGWDGPLQYTLWIVANINGQWAASGVVQFWYGLDASGGDLTADTNGDGAPDQVALNWVYDGRWGPLIGHQPAPGEKVGFLVTAGNSRGVTDGSQSPARERSNVVMIPFPAHSPAEFTY